MILFHVDKSRRNVVQRRKPAPVIEKVSPLTLASVTLNSLRMYWGMLYSAMGSTTKYWYLADRSAGQYWWHFSCWCETK